MNRIYRQGDVLIREVDQIPKDCKPVRPDGDRNILARGEVTNHHHSVALADAEMLTAAEVERYLHVKRETALVHQEHAPVMLPPGNYKIEIGREYSPEAIRRVID